MLVAGFSSVIGFLAGVWYTLDSWNLRPTLKYETDRQGLFITREILKDRLVHDGSLNHHDMLKFCNLSGQLNIKPQECGND